MTFHEQLGMIIPTDELIFVRGVHHQPDYIGGEHVSRFLESRYDID